MKLHIIKLSIPLLFLASISTSVYSDEKKEKCSFAGLDYSIGAIIDMSGTKKICRDGMYERSVYNKTKKLGHLSTDSFSKIEWRDLVEI